MVLPGPGLLFCDPRFHDLNGVPAGDRWRYEHPSVGVLEGVVTDGVLLSGHQAPFGGPQLASADPTVDDVVDLVQGAVAAARADGLRAVRIRARPTAYWAVGPLLEYVLVTTGFVGEHCDLNMHLDLTPGGPTLELLRPRKRRYVRAALQGDWALVDVEGGAALDTLHAIVAGNRADHGRPPPLSRDYLAGVRRVFGDRATLSLLQVDGAAVAAAVVYRVTEDVQQVVHWADHGHDLVRSPMDLLAHLVTERARQDGVRLLDLGPASAKDGSPDPGLVAFKRSVGAVPGTRWTFRADL